MRSRRRSHPEQAFVAGAGAEKIMKFRLRLLVNCKAENYELVTTKKNIFFPDTKLQKLHVRLKEKVVPKVEHVNSVILFQGRKYFFLVLRIHSFLPYNSPGAGAETS